MVDWDNRRSEITEYWVYRVKPKSRVGIRILGPVEGVWLHWVNGRGSMPCDGHECTYCPEPRYHRGYLPALLYIRQPDGTWQKRKIILELPEANWEAVEDDIGAVFEISRGSTNKAPIIIRRAERQPRDDSPPGWDVRPILMHLWGIQKPQEEILRYRKAT